MTTREEVSKFSRTWVNTEDVLGLVDLSNEAIRLLYALSLAYDQLEDAYLTLQENN